MSTRVPVHLPAAPDPLRAVRRLGGRASRDGVYVGLIFGIMVHSSAVTRPPVPSIQMMHIVSEMRAELRQFFWETYVEVEAEKEPEKAKEEEKKEEPKDEPKDEEPEKQLPPPPPPDAKAPPPPPPDDPYKEPPPAPAEASDVLTAEGDGVELPWAIVDKDGSHASGSGYSSAQGTAKGHVDRPATIGGTEGGTGTGEPQPPPPPRKSQRRAADYKGGTDWNCPFPSQADLEQIDLAYVVLVVTVGPDGKAKTVQVQSDPGYGFGPAAKRCAMARRYQAALDDDGNAITATMRPIRVRFHR
jgi:periplasmic protein TonB